MEHRTKKIKTKKLSVPKNKGSQDERRHVADEKHHKR